MIPIEKTRADWLREAIKTTLLPGRWRGERGRKAPAFRPGMKSPLSHPSCRRLLLFDVLLDDGNGGTAT